MNLNTTGEALRDHGCDLADSASKRAALELRKAILVIAVSGQLFTADDLPNPDDTAMRSNRFGSSFLALSRSGLITFTGQCQRSNRAHRHAGINRVWKVADVAKCQSEIKRLEAELALLEPLTTQGNLFDPPVGGVK